MKFSSLCVHGSNDFDNPTGSITVPIYQTATYKHPGVGQSTGYDYSRLQNPTRQQLETLVAKLENGVDCLAFSTGMAATTAMMELFNIGDHIIASDDLYGGSVRLFDNISKKNGLTVEYVDTLDLNLLKSSIKTNTKAIFIETPSNPLMQVTDIKAVSEIAKANDCLLIVDNTFLTPYLQKPLTLGADIIIHSGTKYLCGHNDTLAGFLVVGCEKLAEELRFIYKTVGSCLGPFDCWLLIRGIKTLSIRMDKQEENAHLVANWLKTQDKIKKLYYTGLPDHPNYELSKRQAKGFGGMISFEVDTVETAHKILESVQMIFYAESLGGVETLMTYPMLQTHGDIPEDIRNARGINDRLLRLSVGIEDAQDIIDDLKQAFSAGIEG